MERLFATAVEVPASPEELFAFFSRAENVVAITPPGLRLTIVSGPAGPLGAGARIAYRLRVLGVPLGWETLISEWDPPRAFVDEQLSGPFALWVHHHELQAGPRGTMVRDRIRYRLPLAPFGEAAAPFVARRIAAIFRYRGRALAAALGGPSVRPGPEHTERSVGKQGGT